METIHVKFDELITMASECNNSRLGFNCFNFQDSSKDSNFISSKEDLDNQFGPMYEEYYATRSLKVSDSSAVNTLNREDTLSSSSIAVKENEAPQIVTSLEEPVTNKPTNSVLNTNADESVPEDVAELDKNLFTLAIQEAKTYEEYENELNNDPEQPCIDANYNPYLNVSKAFNNHAGNNDEETIREERKPNDDHCNFDKNLVWNNVPYHASEEEEQYEEDRCEILRNPRQELPVYKIRRFEMIKYSFRPAEKYIAIKECEYDDLTRTKEDVYHAYQEIFYTIDEGCS
nr:hypothetical protein [Tanacetum cinerariifolium]